MYLATISGKKEYTLKFADGNYNYRRFINTLDYSLDLIKLREVYFKAYRNSGFSWWHLNKEYSTRIINVTFKYSIKQYNRLSNGLYIRHGYGYSDVQLVDNIDYRDGVLIAVQTGMPVENPVSAEILGNLFRMEDGVYVAKDVMPQVMSRAELRHWIYKNGFNLDGTHYCRYKRSAGSARIGKCNFIDEKMYGRMHTWDMAGLPIYRNDPVDLAALESYISLTSSSIIDTMEIRPENILLVDDYESKFSDEAVMTYLNDKGEVITEQKTANICNSIFDGESLLDTSFFGNYRQYGFLLLRNRFFKSAAFHCNIQQFFADNGITEVSQLRGKTRATNIKDIKLITTPSSIKYLKFGSFDKWLDNLDPTFGIVKHEKPTHFMGGRLVQTHYQLLNSLQMFPDEVREFLQPSLDYARLLKTNPAVFRHHVKFNQKSGFQTEKLMSRNEIVYKFLGLNDEFTKTKMYAKYRDDNISSFINDMRKGHVLVNGTYCTLCGNPMEMLRSAIGQFDGTTSIEPGTVYNARFADGQTLLGSRSPHVCAGNILLCVNKYNEEIDRYFQATNEIIYVNSINENLLERLSGCDYDSDTLLITDDPTLIKAAQRNYDNFAVPTRLIEAVKMKRTYCDEDLADLDVKTSVNKIGEVINLSQVLNSRLWDAVNNGADVHSEEIQSLYRDISYLDVLSNLSIDAAKKHLPVDIPKELTKLKKKHELRDEDNREIKPNFFKPVSKAKGYYNPHRNNYKKHKTTMDYVQTVLNSRGYITVPKYEYVPFSHIISPSPEHITNTHRRRVQKIVDMAKETSRKLKAVWGSDINDNISPAEKFMLAEDLMNEQVEFLRSVKFDATTARLLFRIMEKKAINVPMSLMETLFSAGNESLFEIIRESHTAVPQLRANNDGNIVLYGASYSLV